MCGGVGVRGRGGRRLTVDVRLFVCSAVAGWGFGWVRGGFRGDVFRCVDRFRWRSGGRMQVVSPEYALPATVAAAHLTASAAELAKDASAVGDLADLTAVMDQLVAGQQHIAVALGKLADHIAGRHRDGSLAAVDAPEIAAL